jgi:phage terminase large subunit-like protein
VAAVLFRRYWVRLGFYRDEWKMSEDISLVDVLNDLSKQFQQQARKPNIFGYKPHDKQKAFHDCCAKYHTILYIGGNRSGKSYGAVAEDLIWMLHLRSDIPDEPIRGRVVAVDIDRGIKQILHPIFKILCPPKYLKGGSWEKAYAKKENVLHFADGGFIEFMSYEQSTEKFAGTSRHFIHFDEEPPENIYNECLARLVDTNGKHWISMTPVEGITWVYEKIYEPGEGAEDKIILTEAIGDEIGPVWTVPSQEFAAIEVGMNENPHLSAAARERYLRTLDPDERRARSKGHFVQMAGKVFKSFSVETHVKEMDFDAKAAQRSGWQLYSSTDHGWNSPTAWTWHAVSPEGKIVTFAEHYKSEMTIDEHSNWVHELEKGWGIDRENIIRTGDPAMKQHSAITGTNILFEYAKNDLFIYTDSVPKDGGIGIGKMQQYFRLRKMQDGTLEPMWIVSAACPNLIKELKNLRFKVYQSKKIAGQNNPQEQVQKVNDHAFDACKYFATFLPDLAPEAPAQGANFPGRSANMDYDEALVRAARDARELAGKTQWTTVETYN